MIPQGYPLFLAQRAAGIVYLIIGWTDSNPVCVPYRVLWPDDDQAKGWKHIMFDAYGEMRVGIDEGEMRLWADKN